MSSIIGSVKNSIQQYTYQSPFETNASGRHITNSINLLLVIALAVDLLAPTLIWKGIIPAQARWISHAAIAIMVVGVLTRILVFNKIPAAVWAILVPSVVGVSTALLRGQGLAPTGWGWWVMFQYPLVCLFCYLQPAWPDNFSRTLRLACIAILAFEVVIQSFQFLTGVIPGDQLAGTFGQQGTGNLVIFVIFILSLELGNWLTSSNWKGLAIVLVLGSISSVLGEMKLFPLAVVALGLLSVLFYVIRGKPVNKLLGYLLILGVMTFGFTKAYDLIVPSREGATNLVEFIKDPAMFFSYMDRSEQEVSNGQYYYDFGRNFALTYGWNTINVDTQTLLFGFGIGARGESRTLGTAGQALVQGNLGMNSGTSLLVLMQEQGLFGLLCFAGFMIFVIIALIKDINRFPNSANNETRYAVLLFTILWPLWLWYNTVFTLRVPMLIYWATLGYVFYKTRQETVQQRNEP